MTKKNFLALADMIRESPLPLNQQWINKLADYCQAQNPRFNRARWLGYIAGTNGRNGRNGGNKK